jgi:threonine synthase
VAVDSVRKAGRLWDYAALLPVREPGEVRCLGEGNTPLLRIDSLNREIGLPNLHLKLESVNPTGSFKDRLHSVTMTAARELGFNRAVLSTTGNSGAAAAAYAALNGVKLTAILNPKAPQEARRQMQLFGAVTAPQGGEDSDAMPPAQLMESLTSDHGFYPCTLMGTFAGPANPYGVEGYKTIAFEVRAQLGRAPDRMCVPTSGGDALYGPHKGFLDMWKLGITDSLPRMTACQAEGAAFVVRSRLLGLNHIEPVEPNTVAISIGDPTGSEAILMAINESGGDAWDASDAEILDAMLLLGKYGICVEAASATPIAALRRQIWDGNIDPGESVVAVLTASGMRWMSQIEEAIGHQIDHSHERHEA